MKTAKNFDFGGVQDRSSSTDQSSESVEADNEVKQGQCHGVDSWGESEISMHI